MLLSSFRSLTAGLIVAVALSVFSIDAVAQNKYEDSYNYQRALEALNNDDYATGIEYLNKEVAAHKDNGYAYYYLALTYETYEDYGRALTAINNSLKYLPKKDKVSTAHAYRERADLYEAVGQSDKALADYTAAIKLAPKEIKLYEARAEYYYNKKRYAESDADFNQILKIDPDYPFAKMGLGRNCTAREEYAAAIDYFDYVAALYSDYSSALSFRAEAYFGLKDYINAASDVVGALAIDHDTKALYLLTKHAEEAYTQLSTRLKAKALSEKNNTYWQYCLGILNESAKKYETAIEAYKKYMDQDPDAIIAYRLMNCYEDLGNWKAAFEYIDKAIEMEPEDLDYVDAKAHLYWYSGDLDSAIEEISKCVEGDPESYEYYDQRGWYRQYNNDLDGALEDYGTAIILEPKQAYSYMCRGRLYLIRGESDLAKEDFTKCTQLDSIPNTSAAYSWFYLGDNGKAVSIMDKLLEDDPEDNYYDAACLYSLMNEKEKALDYMKKALESGFNNFNHMLRDTDLDNIRDTEEYKSLVEQYASKLVDALEESEEEAEWVETVVEVPFTRSGGVTKVKCEINGLPLSFIFDTGASTVSISSLEATFMYKNDYLSAKDIVGKSAFVDANGDISIGTVINLNKVTFGGLELDNVRASVVSNDKAPLLLGQTVLSRLGKVEIDYERSVLIITKREKVTK